MFVCTEDSQQAPACCSADITLSLMYFVHVVQCPAIIHCHQIFSVLQSKCDGSGTHFVFLCWSMEYAILNEVILLEVVHYCSVYCNTGAPQRQILKLLLCKMIKMTPKHAAGDISLLSIYIYLQAIEEIKLT